MAKSSANDVFKYVLRLGDNALIMGQQVCAWCGHAPILEEDIAQANVALDYIGQATHWYTYASELEGLGKSADDLAFLRDEREYSNVLLVEQPNGNFGQTLMRQFIFDSWHYALLTALSQSNDQRIAQIAQKSLKEVTYHLERSTDLIIRLGDGTKESHEFMQNAVDALWRFTGELYTQDPLDIAMAEQGIAPDMQRVKAQFLSHIDRVFALANLKYSPKCPMRSGGKAGLHSEHLGPLLAEMQYLQRAYPNALW